MIVSIFSSAGFVLSAAHFQFRLPQNPALGTPLHSPRLLHPTRHSLREKLTKPQLRAQRHPPQPQRSSQRRRCRLVRPQDVARYAAVTLKDKTGFWRRVLPSGVDATSSSCFRYEDIKLLCELAAIILQHEFLTGKACRCACCLQAAQLVFNCKDENLLLQVAILKYTTHKWRTHFRSVNPTEKHSALVKNRAFFKTHPLKQPHIAG